MDASRFLEHRISENLLYGNEFILPNDKQVAEMIISKTFDLLGGLDPNIHYSQYYYRNGIKMTAARAPSEHRHVVMDLYVYRYEDVYHFERREDRWKRSLHYISTTIDSRSEIWNFIQRLKSEVISYINLHPCKQQGPETTREQAPGIFPNDSGILSNCFERDQFGNITNWIRAPAPKCDLILQILLYDYKNVVGVARMDKWRRAFLDFTTPMVAVGESYSHVNKILEDVLEFIKKTQDTDVCPDFSF